MGSVGRLSSQLLLHVVVVSLARWSPQETHASECRSMTDPANVSFNGSSYAVFPWSSESSSVFEMALNFKVRPVLNGSLFQMRAERQTTTFLARIRVAFPCFGLVTGTTTLPEMVNLEICPVRPLDGWYNVAVEVSDSMLRVELNEVVESTHVDLNGLSFVSLRFGYLETSGEVGFTGCMGDVWLNRTALKLREDAVEQKDLRACSRGESFIHQEATNTVHQYDIGLDTVFE